MLGFRQCYDGIKVQMIKLWIDYDYINFLIQQFLCVHFCITFSNCRVLHFKVTLYYLIMQPFFSFEHITMGTD